MKILSKDVQNISNFKNLLLNKVKLVNATFLTKKCSQRNDQFVLYLKTSAT